MVIRMRFAWVVVGVLLAGAAFTGCQSGGSSHTTSRTTAPTAGVTAPPVAGNALPAKCPTQAEAVVALGRSYSGPVETPAGRIGVVCEYAGGPGGNAEVTIFAHQRSAVYAGQVANAGRAPGMKRVSGVGDGAFALTAAGRSIVNAYVDSSHTVVAVQSPRPVAATEALAKVALADNS
jgi:hypothetical protein